MQIRGKVLSISGSVAEVCIIRERIACGECSACLKKLGLHDIIKVATVKKLQVNQEVVLKDNKNWFIKNRIIFIVIGFVLGVIITEALSAIIFFGVNRGLFLEISRQCLLHQKLLDRYRVGFLLR